MQNLLPNDWQNVLKEEFVKPYWTDLVQNVTEEYEKHTCYPPLNDVFNAFKHCAFNKIKVVIIGQDPYHGKEQANGLCFSYVRDQKLPPSLRNIFKLLHQDLECGISKEGNLAQWAKQGVLLLNTTLTVTEATPNSHKDFGWGHFTDTVIKKISEEKKGVVFVLWGGFAQKKQKMITVEKHKIIKSCHPAPPSCYTSGWFNEDNKPFTEINNYLKSINKKEIEWKLIDENQPPTLFTL